VLDSLVLTEDDYLDFLVNMSRDISKFLPAKIQVAVTGSVLFVGYSLADIDFRVLFRGLLGNLEAALGKMSVAVQLPYEDANKNKEKAEEYITQYFGNIRTSAPVRVYWGTAKKFAEDLWDRWKKFNV
jgi:SIR2-like protein